VTLPSPIRPLGPADFAACRALTLDREWGTEDAVWRFLLAAVDGFGFDDPAGGLAGCVMVARYGDDVASVGMMLVASRWERQGLGRRLMEQALEHAVDRVVVLYATGMGRPLYEKLGFQVVDEVTRHKGTYTPTGPSSAAVRAALTAWVRERGLEPTVTFPLMVYGGPVRGDRTIPYVIASLSLG
jgi:GNAT superfamily N-acetyltransferase